MCIEQIVWEGCERQPNKGRGMLLSFFEMNFKESVDRCKESENSTFDNNSDWDW